MIDHFGEYNPWDVDAETRKLVDEARSSGGFAMRTGVFHLDTGRYTGDGLLIVKVSPAGVIESSITIADKAAK